MEQGSEVDKAYILNVRVNSGSKLIGKTIGTIEGMHNGLYEILSVNGIKPNKDYTVKRGNMLEVKLGDTKDKSMYRYYFGALAYGATGIRDA